MSRSTRPSSVVRPDSAWMRYAVGVAVKETIWKATTSHRQGAKPNICLFATPRGGSTWLMEIIGSEPRVRYLHEPFASWFGLPAQVRKMPKYECGHPVRFSSDQEEQTFAAYTELLLSGRATVNARWDFWKSGYTFRSDRLVLKILEAKALIDWFDSHFDIQVVLLTRNPVATALSQI